MSKPALSRVAWTAALGLALALSASSAFAGGGKPAKPAPKAPASPAFGTFSELESAADEAELESQKEMRKKRYEWVVAYLASHADAKDAEAARAAAMDLAEELEDWRKAGEHADAYLAAHADGKRASDAKVAKATSLGKLGKTAEAKAAFEAIAKGIDASIAARDAVIGAINIHKAWADAMLEGDDVEGAKAALQALKDLYAAAQFGDQIAQLAQGELTAIEAIGTEPAAFPEDAKDLDGKAISLGDYKGKVLLIDFWATWCGPCRAEMPNVIKAYAKWHDKGFEVLGISRDQPGDVQKIKDFSKEKGMAWRQIHDIDGKTDIARTYGVEGIPHMILVGRDGKVVRVGLRGEALQRKLAQLMTAK